MTQLVLTCSETCTSEDNTEILSHPQMSSHQGFSNMGALPPGTELLGISWAAELAACVLLASGKSKIKCISSNAFHVSLQMAFARLIKLQVLAGVPQASPAPAPGPWESSA